MSTLFGGYVVSLMRALSVLATAAVIVFFQTKWGWFGPVVLRFIYLGRRGLVGEL